MLSNFFTWRFCEFIQPKRDASLGRETPNRFHELGIVKMTMISCSALTIKNNVPLVFLSF